MRIVLKLAACKAVEIGQDGGRVLLIPWGESVRDDGIRLLVDPLAARLIQNRFDRLGRDVVIDYEHHSLGGDWSAPDGRAIAAGWMKKGTLEVVPGEGVYCQVEWTPQAASEIANKQYRFLSPATYYDAKTGRVFEIPCAGLTNDPALRMPALVNSGQLVQEKEFEMEGSSLSGQLKELLKLGQDASEEDILAKVKEIAGQIQSGETSPVEGAAVIEALADMASGDMAGEAGEEVAEAANRKDYKAAAKALRLCVNRLKNPVGKVDAAELARANERIAALESRDLEREWETLLAANSNRILPSEVEYFRKRFMAGDAEELKKAIPTRPEIVANRRSAPAGGQPAGGGQRGTLIANARSRRREEETRGLALLGDERAYIDGELRAAGLERLTDAEAGKLGV